MQLKRHVFNQFISRKYYLKTIVFFQAAEMKYLGRIKDKAKTAEIIENTRRN